MGQLLGYIDIHCLCNLHYCFLQDDYGKVQPKMGPAIPPYNAHFDRYAQAYFSFKGVQKTLAKTGQVSLKGNAYNFFSVTMFLFAAIIV